MAADADIIANEFRRIIDAAYEMSSDVGTQVEEILRIGLDNPLPREEAERLINRVIEEMRRGAEGREDTATAAKLDGDLSDFVNDLISSGQHIARHSLAPSGSKRLVLSRSNGIEPHPVLPTPVFHQRGVPVIEGFVKTKDVVLWDENERLDIHIAQFQRVHDRKPESDEIMDIMLSNMDLPGIGFDDQFKIAALARSIAVNGVRKSPIIDVDGKLLDGNRRFAACHLILNSEEFTPAEKARAETIMVWQLTEHATDDDREAVIVSLNFEPDHKQDWPEYVKAHKVHNEWEAMLAREPRANSKRQATLKKEVSKKFALGPDATHVNRYIKMVEMAMEFEDYNTVDKKRDHYEVKHTSEKYFQYFDELNKGRKPGGVHFELNQDEAFKHLVFDLLYDGKFSNWNKIRPLRYFPGNEDAMQHLQRAREERDVEKAQDIVDQAIGLVQSIRAEKRMLGANTRIESFVSWLVDLPVKVFHGEEPGAITAQNLERLHAALKLVEGYLVGEGIEDTAGGSAAAT